MRRPWAIVIFILAAALTAGFFDYPQIWDRGINWWNNHLPYPKLPGFHKRPFKLGLDLAGGAHLLYEADAVNVPAEERDSTLAGLRDVIERRVNAFGVSEPLVQIERSGDRHRLIVELAGVHDIKAAAEAIGSTPYLEFQEFNPNHNPNQSEAAEVNASGVATLEVESPFRSTELTGRFLKHSELVFDQTTFQPQVRLVFNDEGSRLFKELTLRNIGKPLAIVIDGIVISAPTVQQAIDAGEAVITGIEDVRAARTLAENLKAGALPVPIGLVSQQIIGSALGAQSLEASLRAALWGFLLVAVFMVWWYRLAGLAAVLTLLIYGVIALAIFKAIPVVLTLAGIAGFILSLGMAVDGNILTFERLREELKAGRVFPEALRNAVRRAWPSIRDGQITTLLIAVIMFFVGTSLVKGFGLTLGIGVVLSIATSVGVTPLFLRLAERTRLAKYKWLWG